MDKFFALPRTILNKNIHQLMYLSAVRSLKRSMSSYTVGRFSARSNDIDRLLCRKCIQLQQGHNRVRVHLQNRRCMHVIAACDVKDRVRLPVFHSQHRKQIKHLQREIQTLSSQFQRSGLLSNQDLAHLLSIGSRCMFSTSPVNRNSNQDEDDKGKSNDFNKKLNKITVFTYFVASILTVLYAFVEGREISSQQCFISWNEFYNDILAKGEVERIIIVPNKETAYIRPHRDAVIKGVEVDRDICYALTIPDPHQFEEKVRMAEAELGIWPDDGVPISYHRGGEFKRDMIVCGVLICLLYFLNRRVRNVPLPGATDIFANERKAKFVRVDVMSQKGKGISFKDVAGLKEAKVEVIEFVDYLKTPLRFKELGAKIPHGALLLGPPGCGKTLLAKAVATEAKVPFLAMAGSEFVEMVGGLGAARVRDLFKEARKKSPCIIYIDEIDAIGRKRSGSAFVGSQEEEQTLNQLLVEMDGIGTQEGVILLASTNRASVLDKALLRPGRFDRHITIDLPTLIERREIFEMYLKNLKLVQDVSAYAPKLAQLTPGMSGADIANICNEAAIKAARDKKTIIDTEDFDYAVERVIAGVEKKTRLLSPTEKKVVAYHESGHALVGWMLKYTDALLRISIVPRTNSALGFAQYLPSDQKLYTTEELFERMCMALGGRAAEAIIFNHITSGAQDDLKKVTKMAYSQIRSYGMNENIGHLSFPEESSQTLGTKPYSKKLSAMIDEEARGLVARAYKHTEQLLQQHKEKLHVMASELLEREVLTYDEIEKLIGAPPFGKKNKIEPIGWEGIMPSNDNDLPRKNDKERNEE